MLVNTSPGHDISDLYGPPLIFKAQVHTNNFHILTVFGINFYALCTNYGLIKCFTLSWFLFGSIISVGNTIVC